MKLLKRSYNHIGQRGALLLVFAATYIAYGAGLLFGYHPTFSRALDVPVSMFGYLFIAAGIVFLVGAIFRFSRVPFSVALSVTTFWVFMLLIFWSTHRGFAWVAVMPWVTIGFTQLISALQPDLPRGVLLMPKALDDTDPAMRAIEYVDKVKKRTLDHANAQDRATR